jgi:hypothetical protein
MPSFIIIEKAHSPGKPMDAIMCDPTAVGYPDKKSGVPVKATISDNAIQIDDEPRPRSIISILGANGVTTFTVDGSTKALRNRTRRAALAKALSELNQLTTTLRPLVDASAEPELAAEGLGLIYNWIADERERLTEIVGLSKNPTNERQEVTR